ncbi:MAG TPA: FHA domain-containing protein, partial [Pseudobdellovibrionaceae bacterium]|nr:FHA domain-containing protein [Pseudobdellovibrionaceae bacterium]
KQAKEADPTNTELDLQIDSMMNVIKKKMMEIYQLGILDESFGKVDEAIARWKLIIKEDVPDGEYYKKAYIKLKKYGAL